MPPLSALDGEQGGAGVTWHTYPEALQAEAEATPLQHAPLRRLDGWLIVGAFAIGLMLGFCGAGWVGVLR
jgi:hypothetical protein